MSVSKQNKAVIGWLVFILAVAGGLIALASFSSSKPGELDSFAQCLGEKEATFYGAYWCPHCSDQKKMFGRSANKLPYVECSTADGQGQLPVCAEKDIKGYPTWVFADGTRESRTMSLVELATKTSCFLPGESDNSKVVTPTASTTI